MKDFSSKNNGGVINGIEISAEILTNGHWPEQPVASCTLPQELQVCAKKFEDYYKYKYSNRHLQWLFHHGNVEVQPLFTQKKYIMVTNCF